MKVFLAIWKHNHGEDVSLHKDPINAQTKLASWARESLDDWLWHPNDEEAEKQQSFYGRYSDKKLIANWSAITGENESMNIEELDLLD